MLKPLRLLLLLVLPGEAFSADLLGAQGLSASEPDVPEKAGKELHAFRIVGASPQIDGNLDDGVWTLAASMDDLVQIEPDNGSPATERTVVQVAYDDQFLYVAARCYLQDPAMLRTGLGRRDNFPPSDQFWVSFDPKHDHLTAYVFGVNPSGVQSDVSWSGDTRVTGDYDAVWEVRTGITPEGWMAEFRIPFSQMRFDVPPGPDVVWGFNVRRDVQRRGEIARWIGTPRGTVGFVSRFGHLVFADRLAPPRRIELLPFGLARRDALAGGGVDHGASGGLDLRVGLGTSATLSATINPDFAQVEQDPAVLNLTVFETFFPEKRPFFLEDATTFLPASDQFQLFYSRRIGQHPNRFPLPPGDRLVHVPEQTTILGAAKVTGKRSDWTYGALTALTSREHAVVDATSRDADGREIVARVNRLIEPRTLYNVGRLQRDLRAGSSTVGAIATAVVREGDADAFTGGGDANLRWGRNRYAWNTQWVATRAPIAGVLRTGNGGLSDFTYSATYLGYGGHFERVSPDFQNTDLGFLITRTNKNEVSGWVGLNQPDPRNMFRSVFTSLASGRQWNEDGLVFGRWVRGDVNVNFRNFWNAYIHGTHNFERFDDLDTRGGPPILRFADTMTSVGFGSDSRKSWSVSGNVSVTRDAAGGWNRSFGPSVRFQPSASMQSSIGANYTVGQDVAQWIRNADVDADGVADHVYGRLKRHVVSITGRITYAFTRDMTLEAFLQPFVAVGDYSDIRKLARARSFEFTPATLGSDPDFNRKSVRGTVVLRWEYLRGSALFVVWNRASADPSRPGIFSPLRDLGDALSAPGTNVIAVKVSYWFTP